MLLMLEAGLSLVSVGAMIFSLVVIVASIRWIKDLYKVKKDQERLKV